MKQLPSLTIIIVTYNSEDEIVECLDSIFRNDVSVIVYVVDNASSDDTRELLVTYSNSNARVKLILNDDNKGLAAANNQPLPFIESKYTLILNPDILLRNDSLQIMLNAMEDDPSIGMLGPLCLFEDGEPHVSANTTYSLPTIIFWRIIPHRVMRYFFDRYSDFTKKEVLFVSGACYIIPTKLFKELNGYDPAYFLTISDVADIGVRLKKRGYKAIYYPEAIITHFSGRSNAPLKFLTQYWGLTGDLYFINKHMGVMKYTIAKFIFVFGSFMRGLVFAGLSLFGDRKNFNEKAKLYFDLSRSLMRYAVTKTIS